jgi:chromosome segregation ATPase
MCKKIVIAALAVGLGLAVVKGTWLGSHLRFRANKFVTSVRHSVPPEQEIARLKMELKNLERDDDKHFHKVAEMMVKVGKFEREVAQMRTNLVKEEKRIRDLRDELNGPATFVMHQGTKYTNDDLRNDALSFRSFEENLKSKEEALKASQKHLAVERKKLTDMRTVREQMATELQRLETSLAEERQAQAASESTIDDSKYRRFRKDMESIRERIEVLTNKRVL